MQTGFLGHRLAFEHLLDQLNTTAWPIQFVAEQLVGRASSGAKATMNTAAEDCFGFFTGAGIANEIGESGIHWQILLKIPRRGDRG